MNTAGRGVVLAIAAVILGAVILGKGFDDPNALGTTSGTQPTPTATPSGDGGDDGGATDGTDAGSTDAGADAGATDAGDDGTADGGTDGAGATPSETAIPTGGVLHSAAEVRIIVANGTGVQGLAKTVSDSLVSADGYVGLNPANSTNGDTVALTTVYYAPGYQLDASRIAQTLGKTRIMPLPTPPPVEDLQDANIVIELGADSVPA
jgi:hypothetical protein